MKHIKDCKTKTYWIESAGCQMSAHDAERMAGLLEREGYAPTDDERTADLLVINTCSVRERAEEKLFTRLGEIKAERSLGGSRQVVAVTGCVAQQEGQRIRQRSDVVDVVVGTQALRQLPELAARAESRPPGRKPLVDVHPYEDVSFPLGSVRRGDPVKAFVTIIEGCNDFCSFCVVPYTRGHERMRPAAEILAEVGEAVASGRREVHLLGQIVNHYRAPDEPALDFAGLVRRAASVPRLVRLRFASPHPRHVGADLIQAYVEVPQIARHLHLPVQSGSNRILDAMRRRHSREDYLALVDRIRSAVPDVALSTDMIVGFPGETAEDFEQTLSLAARVRFHSMFSFKYSPRPNTLARKRYPDDVSEGEKAKRIVALQELQRRVQLELFEALVGTTVEVLVDGPSKRRPEELQGRTSQNTVVNFAGESSWVGRLAQVTIERAGPNSLAGYVVDVEAGEPGHAG